MNAPIFRKYTHPAINRPTCHEIEDARLRYRRAVTRQDQGRALRELSIARAAFEAGRRVATEGGAP
jgi:hypothetical protein